MEEPQQYLLAHQKLESLINLIKQNGFRCIGPQVRDGAIVYDALDNSDQLPWGYQDQQEPGKYRLTQTGKKQAFLWANGPQSIKPLLFKAKESVWKVARNTEGKLEFVAVVENEAPMAVLGVRACDIRAMEIQDKVFIEDQYPDPRYQKRRQNLFIIAVNCTYSSQNCFCVSAGGFPQAKSGFDIAMTELGDTFVIEVGSQQGQMIVDQLGLPPASNNHTKEAENKINMAAKSQTKSLTAGNNGALRDILFNNLEHPQWDIVADRCLSCGNCTSVCPTCFCHREIAEPELDGENATHIKEWDSCFTKNHSQITGHVIRDDTRKRYRQWLTHKLGSWHDQFGTSGCVGCGRCISWCPVGIDITEEANAITADQLGKEKSE